MKWSKYNYMLNSEKYGVFIYNSSSNSFLKINTIIFEKIQTIDDWTTGLSLFDNEFQEVLLKHKIIVSDNYDRDYFDFAKYLTYNSQFTTNVLNLTIATTTNCNFKCPYCYEAGIAHVNMNQEVEQAIIKFIGEANTVYISWYGGEPLMNFNSIVRLTEEIESKATIKNTSYSIVTNGYYLDEEKCRFFAVHKLKSIQITIDGTEETHNNSRISKNGKPSFATIVSNIDRGLELMPDTLFMIRVNISMSNKNDYPVLYKQLHERWGNYKNLSVYLSFTEDYNTCEGSFFRSREKILFLKELAEEHGIYETRIYPAFESNTCVANMKNSYVISANGDLYKCWSDMGKSDKRVGSIFEPKKTTNHMVLAEYAIRMNKFEDTKCTECFLFPVCSGGCPFHKYENVYEGREHDICPYLLENIDLTLEWMYEHHLRKTAVQQK